MQQAQDNLLDFDAPWESFADLPRFSAGWRIGDAEESLVRWHDRYAHLGTWERRHYRRSHRRPLPQWFGFYALCSRNRWLRAAGMAATVSVYFVLFFVRIMVGPFAADRIKID